MKVMPVGAKAYKKTPEFTEGTVPKGLLADHQTKQGVWGNIVVLEGVLEYTILEPEREVIQLSPEHCGVVEPAVLHYITPRGAVRFYVEFYR